MNVSRENIDDLNAIIKVQIFKDDYEEKVNNILTDYRKKIKLDGFRPGKVPMGLIKKMHGPAILVEEINKLISEAISKNITEDKLHILGEPLPAKDQKAIDWKKDDKFEFSFDLGLAPVFDLNLSKKDKIKQYKITIDEKLIDSQKNNIAGRYGNLVETDVVKENEVINGLIEQLNEEGEVMEGGIIVEKAMIHSGVIKDEKEKKKFIGAKKQDIIRFNPRTAFPNETDLASLLKIEKENIEGINSDFRISISEISKYKPAEINVELFDRIYGEGKIKTVEEFDNMVVKDLEVNFLKETEYKFTIDTRDVLLAKVDFNIPDAFLKRWLLESNKTELSPEKIEEDYPKFTEDLKWQLIKDKIIVDNELKVEDNELLDFARDVALAQFRQYGINDVPDEQLDSYANEILKKEDEKRKIHEKLLEHKVIQHVKNVVKVEMKELSVEKFNKLFAD